MRSSKTGTRCGATDMRPSAISTRSAAAHVVAQRVFEAAGEAPTSASTTNAYLRGLTIGGLVDRDRVDLEGRLSGSLQRGPEIQQAAGAVASCTKRRGADRRARRKSRSGRRRAANRRGRCGPRPCSGRRARRARGIPPWRGRSLAPPPFGFDVAPVEHERHAAHGLRVP